MSQIKINQKAEGFLMFSFLAKKLKFLQLLKKNLSQDQEEQNKSPQLTANLKTNLQMIKNILGNSDDIIIRPFVLGTKDQQEAALIMIDGLIDKASVHDFIIKPLMLESRSLNDNDSLADSIEELTETLVCIAEVKKVKTLDELVNDCLKGDTALLVNGHPGALIINTRGWKSRGIEQPQTEVSVRGPREGFTETLRVNTALIRRKIRDPDLTFETMTIGKRSKTDVTIVYLKGVVRPGLVEEIKKRLKKINTDLILESGYIEQFIEDAPFSPFSTIGNTERPDTVAAKIMEGRAAILVDGTPMVLTVPLLFIESFQTMEDYYSRPYYASVVRLLRMLSFFISIMAPATYVALTTFHQELLPTPLALSMASAREGVPFPAFLEAFLLGLAFEILREAGIRLPQAVGTAISIVGALVIGEAAVSAGLVSAPLIIVVAITAISSFAVIPQSDASAFIRFILLLLASTLGIFGISVGLLGILIHLATLKSFGVPYLAPFAPLKPADLKDTLIRFPLWLMITRPSSITKKDPQREKWGLMPRPQDDNNKG